MAAPSSEVPESCCICNEEFFSQYELTKHLIHHSNEQKFQQSVSELEGRLSKYLAPTTAPRRTAPLDIEPEFLTTNLMRSIYQKNVPEIITISDDEPSNNSPKLQKRMHETASQCYPYPSTSSVSGVKRENVAIKTEPSNFFCHICKEFYGSKGSLKHHLFRHIGDPRFKCGICGKQFTLQKILRKHKTFCK